MLSGLVTGSMVKRSKPDPEGYLTGAQLIGVPIEDCYVFEDSLQGLQAGMSSGATVIGLATTNSRSRLKGKPTKSLMILQALQLKICLMSIEAETNSPAI